MHPFLALITPIGSGEQPPQPPLGIWGPTDPRPTPPIYWPGFPGGGGGGGGQQPPGIWGPLPGFPTNPIPIYPGGTPNPPGIWGGGNVPMPTPPIQLPPWMISGGQPPGIWGPLPGFPSNPISGIPGLPGYEPPKPGEQPPAPPLEMKVGWTAQTGWVVVWVPTEGTPVVTPSADEPRKFGE